MPLTSGDPDAPASFGDIVNALRLGIFVGPLQIHAGLGLGWEYSDRNYNNQATNSSDRSSYFVAPSIGLVYDREVGPWSVFLSYGGGLRYYLNPNYDAAGSGNQRNPFSQTVSLSVAHLGARHRLMILGSGSYGTGFSVNNDTNVTQTAINAGLEYEYMLTSYTNIGARAAVSSSLYDYQQNEGTNSTMNSLAAGTYFDWLYSGKTRLRFSLDAGQSSQNLQGSQAVDMNYVQFMAATTYAASEKLKLEMGLGAGYVTNSRVNSKYTGFRPVYQLAASYAPTEKTSIRASIGFQGTDVQPDFSLAAAWQPRVNTGLSLSVYQNQGYSLSVSEQVQVSRGFVASINQTLFSKLQLVLSAGWQQTENVSLVYTGEAAAQNNQTFGYGFGSATLTWNLRDWASWQLSTWYATGSQYQYQNQNAPETRATVSFNLTF